MIHDSRSVCRASSRRDFLVSALGGAALISVPELILAQKASRMTGSARAQDWQWLAGNWDVRHRRLQQRLAGSNRWDEFDGTLVNWPILGGNGNVGDNLMRSPAGAYRGMGFRAWNPAAREWLSWWLDGRDPARISEPLHGRFVDGAGTFISDDVHEGRPIKARVTWSRITSRSARWEQSFSADGGHTWEVNWTSDFARAA